MLYFWSAAMGLVFLAFVTLVVVMRILRRSRRAAERPADTDLSLETLHTLMLQGKISRKEFEHARRASIRSRRVTNATGPAPRRQGFEVLEPRDHF